MGVASMLVGLFALGSACVAFMPALNLVNYCVTFPLALLGIVLSLVALASPPERVSRLVAGTGLALSLLAMLLAGVRVVISLFIGAGIL